MIAGSAMRATIHSCRSTPALVATRVPATAARPPAIAHDSANTRPTLMPCVSAASWSKAVARIASP